MNIPLLQKVLEEGGQPSFRVKQILEYYFSKAPSSWDDIPTIPKELIVRLNEKVPFTTLEYKDHQESDDVIKFVFTIVESGDLIEAVVMKHKDPSIGDEDQQGRRTLCVSCQSGCPMGCYFCATGTMGLKRNMTGSEIADLVREVNNVLFKRGEKVTNIVYMGMGEPFANYEAVKESLHIIHDYIGIGWRKISVSTCGIVPKILAFADDFPQVNLAISLHASIDEKRSKMMPINDTFNIETLMKACSRYVKKTNRKIFFEYLVIDGFNDTKEDAKKLSNILDNPLYHLNLIRFHATDAVESAYDIAWKVPTRERLEAFMQELDLLKVRYTLRRSFGETIDAACGMLALKNQK